MGRKVHPLGFRLGIIRDWQAKWYADKSYADLVQEDLKLRGAIKSRYTEAGISLVQIERQANDVSITIHTARPGIVIGRGGQRVDEIRQHLERLIGKRVRLNIQEIRQPEMDAFLVARNIADQLERRVAYRRAMKQAIFRTIQAGAKGVRVKAAGRLAGAEIARRETMHQGRVPLNTLRADIDYGFTEAQTVMGKIGVKVWIYKGEVLPEVVEEEIEEKPAEVLTETALPQAVVAVEAAPVLVVSEVPEPVKATPQPVVSEAVEKPVVAERKRPKAEPETRPVASEVKEKTAVAVEKPVVAERKRPKAEPEAQLVASEVKEKTAAAEEKPVKPRVRKPRQATAKKAADTEKPTEKEVKDATTQEG